MMQRFIYLFVLCFSFSYGQRIVNFNLSIISNPNQGANSQVLVRFTLTPGQACPGYEVLHCLDSLNYLPIYTYSGLCGDQPTDESFSYQHVSPALNNINYYKISIPGYEVSSARRIYVGEQAPQPSMLIYPNPVVFDSFIKARFYNFADGILQGYLYNQHGVKLKPLTLAVKQGFSEVEIADLNDGLYVIWLTDGFNLFRTKFIVKRA